MRAGKLKHRVQFTRRRPGVDEVGQPHGEFLPLFAAWCSVDPVTGREFFAGQTLVDQVDTKIGMRAESYILPLTDADRAEVQGAHGGTYDIVTILMPEQAGRELRVMAKRTVPTAGVPNG